MLALAAGAVLSFLPMSSISPAAGWMRLVDSDKWHDDQAYVAAKVLNGELRQADVVVFGTSSARASLWPEDALQAAIGQGNGRQRVINLASASQIPLEMLFLTTLNTPRENQIYLVFLGFGALKFGDPFSRLERGAFLLPPEHLIAYRNDGLYPQHWTSWHSRLALRWQALRQRLQRQIRPGLRYWVRETVYGIPAQPYESYRRYQERKQAGLADGPERVAERRMLMKKNFESNLGYSLRALNALDTTLRQNGARMVIAAPPDFEPESRRNSPNEHARFDAAIRAFAMERDIDVVDWNRQIDWTTADALDFTHASSSGRDKWSRAFVAWLADQQR